MAADATLTETVAGSGPRVLFVHGTPGWGSDTFPDQLSLTDAFEVHLVDRRGYPDNPAADRVGFDVDADDLVELLGEGAHLVGQSYGGLGCLLAASRVPERVRSLTVIEPAAYSVARGHPAVEELITRLRTLLHEPRHDSAEDAYRAYAEAFGMTLADDLGLSEKDRRSIEPICRERPAWEAEIPLDALRGLRVAVVSGTYGEHSDTVRARARHAICDVLVTELGAERVVFADGGHNPQLAVASAFNEWLRTFLQASEGGGDRPSRGAAGEQAAAEEGAL